MDCDFPVIQDFLREKWPSMVLPHIEPVRPIFMVLFSVFVLFYFFWFFGEQRWKRFESALRHPQEN